MAAWHNRFANHSVRMGGLSPAKSLVARQLALGLDVVHEKPGELIKADKLRALELFSVI